MAQANRIEERISTALPVRLEDGSTGVTHNISASGIYCKLDREIPLMSRVKLILMMPDPTKDAKTHSLVPRR